MKIKTRKKEGENFGRLIRRFNNAVQRSQILTKAKDRKTYVKPPNKRERKEETLRRIRIDKEKREY